MHPGRLTFNAKNNTDYAMIARLDQLSISTDYSIIVFQLPLYFFLLLDHFSI